MGQLYSTMTGINFQFIAPILKHVGHVKCLVVLQDKAAEFYTACLKQYHSKLFYEDRLLQNLIVIFFH